MIIYDEGRRRAQRTGAGDDEEDKAERNGRNVSTGSSPLTGLNKHLDSRRRLYDRTRRRRDSSDPGDAAPSSSVLSVVGTGAPFPSRAGQALSGTSSSERITGMEGVTDVTSTSGGRSTGAPTAVHVGVGGGGKGTDGSPATQRRYSASSMMSTTSASTARSYSSHKDRDRDKDTDGERDRGRGQGQGQNVPKVKAKVPQVLLRLRLDIG